MATRTDLGEVRSKVVLAVCCQYGIDYEDVMGRRRTAPVVTARQVSYWILRNHFGMSWGQIGSSFGRFRDCARHGCNRVERKMLHRAGFTAEVDSILAVLGLKRAVC